MTAQHSSFNLPIIKKEGFFYNCPLKYCGSNAENIFLNASLYFIKPKDDYLII